ncbi:hypothetical protein [Rhodococcus globerulus]|uniref:Uncharacterized protein n=1 Tax=Rhodococcus globerulus TaxID=33008 RepID=A0ABU4BS44_RHOGO|nr:hypothetical protein [Rhodococcus globerulus]MDV6267044.1 hypothetical protein [Rhodococcus globerulus]
MSNIPHYLEAERLLNEAELDVSANWPSRTGETKADILAAANVHALLAIVDKLEGR